MTTGSFYSLFRTGASANSATELILRSLNRQRGTAYDAENTESVIYQENYAIAQAINNLWESNQRLSYQFDPTRMSSFITRWEQILNIIPNQDSTIEERKAIIGAKFSLISKVPIHQVVKDICRVYLGELFIDILVYTTDDDFGTVPGGATVPGGVTLSDGIWTSPISTISIYTWQKRDHNNNYDYDEQLFQTKLNQLYQVLEGFLPAYTMYNHFRFLYEGAGTVSGSAGFFTLTGVGTDFVNDIDVGDLIEIVDDNDDRQLYTVDTVTDATHLDVVEMLTATTSCFYRIFGFYLDITDNLNNMTLGQ